MIIDCDNCLVRDIACGDCVVSVLIGSPSLVSAADQVRSAKSPGANQLSDDEARVIDLLASRGMIPPLRFTNPEDSQAQNTRSG